MSPSPDEDAARMRAALALARRSLGTTWPNPAVGCVIAREGRVLGRGRTQPSGRPHAEQQALDDAAARFGASAVRDATAWVSLEPCAHHGRTPPCAASLAAAGIRRVVSTFADPDPRVNGRGFAMLREAGVVVTTGVLEAEARALNAGFLSRLERGRPWLTLKLAASLDGRIATASGESRWITGPAARARAHLMRAESDAVMVGAGTARADDPALDVRLPGLTFRRPVRVIADGGLSLPLTSRLVAGARAAPVWVLHRAAADAQRRRALVEAGVVCQAVKAEAGGELDMREALHALGARGLTRVLCEGGGRLAAHLLREDLVDEIVWFSAGAAIGEEGLPAVAGLGLAQLGDAPRFRLAEVEALGGDLVGRWLRA